MDFRMEIGHGYTSLLTEAWVSFPIVDSKRNHVHIVRKCGTRQFLIRPSLPQFKLTTLAIPHMS